MPCTLDSRRNPALVLQRVASDSAWKDFTLAVDELQQEVRVLVVDMLDAELAEAAVFCTLLSEVRIAKEFYVISRCGHVFFDLK